MKTESEQPTPPHAENDNVVQLPRDWLGPRDELVPVGTPADAPPTAESFWSEDSAALQSAWQQPEVSEPATLAVNPRPGRHTALASVSRAWAPGSRARVVATASVVAVFAAVAVAVSHPGGGGSTHARTGHHSNTTLADATNPTKDLTRAQRSVTRQKTTAHHSHVTTKQPAHKRAAHRHVASASKHSAITTAPATESASSSESQPSAPVATNLTPQHSDSTVTHDDASTGHPTGAGAPFAPGYIP